MKTKVNLSEKEKDQIINSSNSAKEAIHNIKVAIIAFIFMAIMLIICLFYPGRFSFLLLSLMAFWFVLTVIFSLFSINSARKDIKNRIL